MKNYFQHVEGKTPHERRRHAMQIAGAVTAVLFVGWLATLGVRLASLTASSDASQAAAAANAAQNQSTLEVATTSAYTY